jgi:hypothetical protein
MHGENTCFEPHDINALATPILSNGMAFRNPKDVAPFAWISALQQSYTQILTLSNVIIRSRDENTDMLNDNASRARKLLLDVLATDDDRSERQNAEEELEKQGLARNFKSYNPPNPSTEEGLERFKMIKKLQSSMCLL